MNVAHLAGTVVGGFVAVWIVSFFVGKFAFSQQPPDARAIRSSIAAWLICGTLAAFGFGNGDFYALAYLYYLPGAVVVFFMDRSALRKVWTDDGDAFR